MTGEDRPEHTGASGEEGDHIPSDLEKGLAKADDTIKRFTVVSALAGVASAAAAIVATIVAVYTATQIDGTTKQIDRAITQLGNVVAVEQDETNALDNGVAAATNEAEDTNALIGPAITNAKAAVRSLDIQQRDFLADERPRLALLEFLPEAHNRPEINGEGGGLVWNFAYQNYGKSTATDIRLIKYLGVGDRTPLDDGQRVTRGELVRDKNAWTTVYYAGKLTKDEVVAAASRKVPVLMAVVMSYKDEAGLSYTSTICQIASPNGSMPQCVLRDDFVERAKKILSILEPTKQGHRGQRR